MTALLIGTALAVASLCFVLYPLFRADISVAQRNPASGARNAKPRQSHAVDALRELEFDRQTGKISDSDYEPLKARYTEQALAVMRAGNAPVCEKCGPRPEREAEFCSNCGAGLIT
jgi:ribosomal protein L40E